MEYLDCLDYGLTDEDETFFSIYFPLVVFGDKRYYKQKYTAYRHEIRKRSLGLLRDLNRAIKLNHALHKMNKITPTPKTQYQIILHNCVERTFPWEDIPIYKQTYGRSRKRETIDNDLRYWMHDVDVFNTDDLPDYDDVFDDYENSKMNKFVGMTHADATTYAGARADMSVGAGTGVGAKPRSVSTVKKIPKEYTANKDIFQENSNISMSLTSTNDANSILLAYDCGMISRII